MKVEKGKKKLMKAANFNHFLITEIGKLCFDPSEFTSLAFPFSPSIKLYFDP